MMLNITRHARDKMSALAINLEMIRAPLKRGAKFRIRGGKFRAEYSFFAVVYRPLSNGVYKIITVYETK